MIIAISSESGNLDDEVSSFFGRGKGFIIVKTIEKQIKDYSFVKNDANKVMRGAGLVASKIILKQKAKALISGSVGPNAYNALTSANVKIYNVMEISARKAVNALLSGILKEVNSVNSLSYKKQNGGEKL